MSAREELAQLRARYDSGQVSLAVYQVIRTLEIELAWTEHRRLLDRIVPPTKEKK